MCRSEAPLTHFGHPGPSRDRAGQTWEGSKMTPFLTKSGSLFGPLFEEVPIQGYLYSHLKWPKMAKTGQKGCQKWTHFWTLFSPYFQHLSGPAKSPKFIGSSSRFLGRRPKKPQNPSKRGILDPKMGQKWPFLGSKMTQKWGPLFERPLKWSNVHSVHFGPKWPKKVSIFDPFFGQKWSKKGQKWGPFLSRNPCGE